MKEQPVLTVCNYVCNRQLLHICLLHSYSCNQKIVTYVLWMLYKCFITETVYNLNFPNSPLALVFPLKKYESEINAAVSVTSVFDENM